MVPRSARALVNHALGVTDLLPLRDLARMPQLEIHLLSPPHRQSL